MRYLLKFKKEGQMIYISHLDLQRLFKRSIRRAGIKLSYTKGFNPHPKFGFVQPLSLGFFSEAEYLEFETEEKMLHCDQVIEAIDNSTPEGIVIDSIKALDNSGKTLASRVVAADYIVTVPIIEGIGDKFDKYLMQKEIIVEKESKKGKVKEIDIRSWIYEAMVDVVDDKYITFILKLAAGSAANLNPEILLKDFFKKNGLNWDISVAKIGRTAIYGLKDEVLVVIEDLN